MMKLNYIVLIFFFGFILSPTDAYACNSSKKTTQKHACCQTNKDLKTDKKAEKSCSKKSNSEENSCDGSCNNSNCNFTSSFSSIIPNFSFKINSLNEKIVSRKVNFFYLEKNISTHYFSIWCPPKIG